MAEKKRKEQLEREQARMAAKLAQRGGLPITATITAENGVVDASGLPQDGTDARLPLADG